ncbi:farnesol dehydrogenase-like [Rhynchophorus ferrugineus]|uniref:Farnesol dehydrogenase-like n=1 Tax=Rhynchophorus ferrugineus TaxID=354439 RepID=A0A834MKN0_RHYFE|nr:hypothetical protein GWI33_004664 [Rhynchophorus ferrugineus]
MVLSLDRWIGKVAVITGASAGIGAELVIRLADAGIIVVGLNRRAIQLADKHANLKDKIHYIQCDISNEADVQNAFKKINKIGVVHILINNAGTTTKNNLFDGEPDTWRKVLDTNVIGTCIVSKEAIKIMTANKIAGQIININSILGHFVYNIPKANIYPASKHALTALTETLRLELIDIDSDIKVTSLSPGPVDNTEFFVRQNVGDGNNGPIKYFLNPEDIADAAMFVLSTPPHLQVAELMLRPLKEPY